MGTDRRRAACGLGSSFRKSFHGKSPCDYSKNAFVRVQIYVQIIPPEGSQDVLKCFPGNPRTHFLTCGFVLFCPKAPQGVLPLVLLPLDDVDSAVPSFQLCPVFSAVLSRMPPGDTMSFFVGFGDKSWDNFKNFFKLRALSFCFCPKRHDGEALEARYRRKRPF